MVSLAAEPSELVAAVRDDVVGVDAVELRRRGGADERGLRKERRATGVQSLCSGGPLGNREVERPVDVERPHAVRRLQIRDVGDRAGHGAPGVRLEMDGDSDTRRMRRRDDGAEATVLG